MFTVTLSKLRLVVVMLLITKARKPLSEAQLLRVLQMEITLLVEGRISALLRRTVHLEDIER